MLGAAIAPFNEELFVKDGWMDRSFANAWAFPRHFLQVNERTLRFTVAMSPLMELDLLLLPEVSPIAILFPEPALFDLRSSYMPSGRWTTPDSLGIFLFSLRNLPFTKGVYENSF